MTFEQPTELERMRDILLGVTEALAGAMGAACAGNRALFDAFEKDYDVHLAELKAFKEKPHEHPDNGRDGLIRPVSSPPAAP